MPLATHFLIIYTSSNDFCLLDLVF